MMLFKLEWDRDLTEDEMLLVNEAMMQITPQADAALAAAEQRAADAEAALASLGELGQMAEDDRAMAAMWHAKVLDARRCSDLWKRVAKKHRRIGRVRFVHWQGVIRRFLKEHARANAAEAALVQAREELAALRDAVTRGGALHPVHLRAWADNEAQELGYENSLLCEWLRDVAAALDAAGEGPESSEEESCE